MSKYTGIHRFSIPLKYHYNFLLDYSRIFDKSGKLRNMYNNIKIIQDFDGNETAVIYFETIDNEEMQKEIEKLKNLLNSPHWYTMFQTKRLYQFFEDVQQLSKLLKFNNKLGDDYKDKCKYKYLYYLAKSKGINARVGLEFEHLYFIAESDKCIVPEQIMEEQLCDYEKSNCCICIKAALSDDGYERILSSEICSIYFLSHNI